jgi:hypothetical protein
MKKKIFERNQLKLQLNITEAETFVQLKLPTAQIIPFKRRELIDDDFRTRLMKDLVKNRLIVTY